jgi:hypothetical protein
MYIQDRDSGRRKMYGAAKNAKSLCSGVAVALPQANSASPVIPAGHKGIRLRY